MHTFRQPFRYTSLWEPCTHSDNRTGTLAFQNLTNTQTSLHANGLIRILHKFRQPFRYTSLSEPCTHSDNCTGTPVYQNLVQIQSTLQVHWLIRTLHTLVQVHRLITYQNIQNTSLSEPCPHSDNRTGTPAYQNLTHTQTTLHVHQLIRTLHKFRQPYS